MWFEKVYKPDYLSICMEEIEKNRTIILGKMHFLEWEGINFHDQVKDEPKEFLIQCYKLKDYLQKR